MAVQKYVVLLDADHAVTAGEREDASWGGWSRVPTGHRAGWVDG